MRQGWPGIFFICVLLLACGKPDQKNSGKKWSSFPVAIYADGALVSTNQDESDLKSALHFWEGKAGKELFSYQGSWSGSAPYTGSASQPGEIIANVIYLQNPWPFAANIAAQTTSSWSSEGMQSGIVLVNGQMEFCEGNCTGEKYRTRKQKMLAHELGHFLGLPHFTTDPSNLMYPELAPGGSLAGVKIDEATLSTLVN